MSRNATEIALSYQFLCFHEDQRLPDMQCISICFIEVNTSPICHTVSTSPRFTTYQSVILYPHLQGSQLTLSVILYPHLRGSQLTLSVILYPHLQVSQLTQSVILYPHLQGSQLTQTCDIVSTSPRFTTYPICHIVSV
jgi:hypothetical protein